jgi:malonyl-CoA decarboxylase
MSASSFLRRLFGRANGEIHPQTQRLVSLCESLLSEHGEITGVALAREALGCYQTLGEREREEFFDVLAKTFSPSPDVVGRAADAYRSDPIPENLIRLQESAESLRPELFRRLNAAPGATAALVEMRRLILKSIAAHPQWKVIDNDLLKLLRSWFNRGFLRMERIDWHTPAIVLEKLMQYEAVHAIQGWGDLRRRLEADRRCFAFFHPQLPDEPLVFIEVALTRGMSARVQPLLEVGSSVSSGDEADSAMFYSITNCQDGLRGISFGNLLIKQVAEELQREVPQLRTFATLSPIPGFRRWLEESRARLAVGPQGEERVALLQRIEERGWHEAAVSEPLASLLLQLCAWYLMHQKHGAEPSDRVARFHLGNGAALERLNWLGDTSVSGLARSAGIMANYVYRLAEVERNHDRYFRQHVVVASRAVTKLARDCPLAALASADAQPGS